MSKRINIVTNALKAKVINAEKEERIFLTELLSYYVAGYEQTASFKAGRWDGRSTMYDWATDTFPVGFLSSVNANLVKEGWEVANLAKPLPAPLGRLPRAIGPYGYTGKYDYQWEGIQALEKRGICTCRIATGGGKTVTAALAVTRINRPTLILTKRQPLMYQFFDRLRSLGFNPGIIGDNRFNIKKDLTIGMAQTLNSKLTLSKNPTEQEMNMYNAVKDYLSGVEFLIGEEAHEVSDGSYWNVIQHCTNAHYRLGLTATPFMSDKSESNMKLLGAFGGIGIDVSEKLLIDRGINARPIIKFATYEPSPNCRYNSNYQKAVTAGIVANHNRNTKILEYSQKAISKGLPVLVLVQRKEHGKILNSMFKSSGIKSQFIFGDANANERKEALDDLAAKKLNVLIGSTILDVGIDVPAIGLVILAGGGKAEVGYRQRIGRGLRAKSEGPNVCLVLDFADVHNIHLQSHTMERLRVLKETPGFKENILGKNQDFDWDMFGA